MVFTNVINPRSEIRRRPDECLLTLVKEGATIGANATVICGHTIGRYALIGAGSVVTKDIPDYALVYGNSAKIAGWMCECGEKLHFTLSNPGGIEYATCIKCQNLYEKHNLAVRRIE